MKIFDMIWDRLRTRIEEIVRLARAKNTVVSVKIGHHATTVFPLTGYASFSKSGDPKVEDLVVSISCRLEASILTCWCDISDGMGTILADGPTVETDMTLSLDLIQRRISAWIDATEKFLDENLETTIIRICANGHD